MTNDPLGLAVWIAIAAIIAFAVLAVLRHITLWYFRIDEIVDLLKAQNDLLSKQIAFQQIVEDQAARRRSDSTQTALQSHQPQSQAHRPNPLQP